MDGTPVPTRSPQDVANSSYIINEELKDVHVELQEVEEAKHVE
jgi:hypothetical protein